MIAISFAALVAVTLLVPLAAGDAKDNGLVTCGSVIKLEHDKTKHLLASQDVAYGYGPGGRGSGQQVVTGAPDAASAAALWVVRGPAGAPCAQGSPVGQGAAVRLQHAATRRWLHSHLFASPLSGQQEVSAFGGDAETDGGDAWTVEWDGRAPHWARGAPVRFVHRDTGGRLASHAVAYQHPVAGHTEVFAAKAPKAGAGAWRATEGVYFVESPAE